MSEQNLVEMRVDRGHTTLRIHASELSQLRLMGDLSSELCRKIEQNDQAVDHVEVDFSTTGQIGSEGLNCLMILKSKIRQHDVDVILCNVNSPVRDVFRLTRLERLFEFDDSCASVSLI